ncbi:MULTISPECIES: SDR family NAD(P)-dependent oxidoreductase [Methylosinus]|uniref:Acetoacetyl-CoA reductase n=1 Tax=Methylosinus trichosporium (strain ATCC 35070 / NCIMB 11131 / UNIQEM 75 / OB3b) TaxID=595536 RepID=A0A2D2D5P3_METT3|nr:MULTISPECIES: SDR family NAD(P)-dependent oxidoreductase [Methylosinus]ATQ70286.1 acetoacetyl-CoA reductase [Methylosinus trichosporium OB3b]OBS53488.1 acetoacetyl-CoA reductase [Methylosinus sp. 3S-1]
MSAAGKRIVILGATSAIAEATARRWAIEGARLALVARDRDRLEAVAANLTIVGAAEARIIPLDCATADARSRLMQIAEGLGGLDILLLAYGALGDQRMLEKDPAAAQQLIATNFTSAVAWCLAASEILERQRAGVLLVVGSVAGDRGRRSNYIYGACKGGLARLVEGIAHKLAPLGARAVVIKPGFVDTPMTAAIENKGVLWAKPDAVAAIIVKAADQGGPVVYAPAFWRFVMLVIRNIPAPIFHRTKL